MTAILTIAGVITMLLLLASGISTTSRTTASGGHGRGPWGVIDWNSRRSRPLNPPELRWQTAMISGKGTASRWPDFVAEIQALEQLAGTPGITPVPDSYNARWVDSSISTLEAAMAAKTISGDTTT